MWISMCLYCSLGLSVSHIDWYNLAMEHPWIECRRTTRPRFWTRSGRYPRICVAFAGMSMSMAELRYRIVTTRQYTDMRFMRIMLLLTNSTITFISDTWYLRLRHQSTCPPDGLEYANQHTRTYMSARFTACGHQCELNLMRHIYRSKILLAPEHDNSCWSLVPEAFLE